MTAHPPIVSGGGETGALLRSIDWSGTPLGPIDGWPQSLRTALSIAMSSRFPITLYWGADFLMLYNDDLLPMVGAKKHPWALGRPAFEVLPEIRSIIEPLLRRVMDTGEAIWSEDLMLPLERGEAPEEGYFTFTYSPVRVEDGVIGGVFCAVLETTEKVIEGRRLRLLNALADATQARAPAEACAVAAAHMVDAAQDLPFALLYLLDEAAPLARLAGAANIHIGHPLAPETLRLDGEAPWPFDPASFQQARTITLRDAPGGARGAVILPLERAGGGRPLGILVAGLSALLGPSESYGRFHKLLAASLGQALSHTVALEAERRRVEVLAELDRAKTEFFGNVSHELRTPLTLMLAPVEDALDDSDEPLPPAQRARLELVRRNAARLLKLVNTMLDFARIEAGRAQASFVPTDLAALTRDAASNFRSLLEAAGLELHIDAAPLGELVLVDPAMWEKIVFNLLSNAYKFTFHGRITLTLVAHEGRALLTVEDTGTGIPMQELPRLFERFHRVEGAHGRSHEGTGIGLALVKELAQLHSGSAEVQSMLGQGTRVTVAVPLGSAHVPAARTGVEQPPRPAAEAIDPLPYLVEAAQWSATEQPSPLAAPPLEQAASEPISVASRARFLVVDDNADMREYIARVLAPHGEVRVVSDGNQALAAARRDLPDLVVSDVMMPGMSGLELVRALRTGERTRIIPVILLSARAGEEATIEGLESGADAYLVKPFSAKELIARVQAHLQVSRTRQAALRAERAHSERVSVLLAEARRATRAREDTLAVVSHDLRAPLSTVIMALDVMVSSARELAPVLRKPAEMIRRAVARMELLIADLLDLASIDSGTLTIERRLHRMEDLLQDLRESYQGVAAAKGLALRIEAAQDLPELSCDRERILQALGNLVSNAIKYTRQGGVEVHAEREGDAVCVAVSDTGPGIDPEALPNVFDRYWHAGVVRDSHGLGLPIARGIVERHGGRVDAESEVGRGSTFRVTLPLDADAAVSQVHRAVDDTQPLSRLGDAG